MDIEAIDTNRVSMPSGKTNHFDGKTQGLYCIISCCVNLYRALNTKFCVFQVKISYFSIKDDLIVNKTSVVTKVALSATDDSKDI